MRRTRTVLALLALLALLGLLPLAAPTLAAAPLPTESYTALLHQIDARKTDPQRVIAATVDKQKHHIRVTLADGSRPLVVYPAAQDKNLIDTLLHHGVRPIYTKRKALHHTLRYIAAGVVVVLLLIGAGVWAFTRGRQPEDAPSAGSTQ
jgi:hypothetical protein